MHTFCAQNKAMDYDTHIRNKNLVVSMGNKTTTDVRLEIANQRSSTIAAQWAFFVYEQTAFRNRQLKLLKNNIYHYWLQEDLNRFVLFAVVKCHFKNEKLKISEVSKDLGVHRNTISKVLSGAQEKGLLLTVNGCPFKPSVETIDGFTFYTQELLSKDSMAQLAGSLITLKFGTFNVNITPEYDANRISVREGLDE